MMSDYSGFIKVKVTPQVRKNIIKDREDGMKMEDLAVKYKVSSRTINRHLPQELIMNKRLTLMEIKGIVDLKIDGLSVKYIAKKYGISTGAVRMHLPKDMHPGVTRITPKQRANMAFLYRLGMSRASIGKLFKVTRTTVYNWTKGLSYETEEPYKSLLFTKEEQND